MGLVHELVFLRVGDTKGRPGFWGPGYWAMDPVGMLPDLGARLNPSSHDMVV
jgi:hypothetical protein